MKKSAFTQEEEQLIQREFETLLAEYAQTNHVQKVELITRAFQFANNAHTGVRRLSGEPYMMHPLAVARICVKEIGLGSTSICAALLHDVVEDTDYTVDDIRSMFGDKIAQIVDGLTKISGGVFGDQASEQAENFRKLLLTISDDIRVVIIKIADRLHNMRTLGAQPKEKQYKIAGETQYIYAPLAHRLGLFPIKTELEDLSFKYEHPDTYEEIDKKLQAVKDAQLETFEQFAEPIRVKLKQMGYDFTLVARIKSVFSIWSKMNAKQIPFEDVYDLLAVRIIFTPHGPMTEKDQCWTIYSAITDIYKPHPERIRDWISTPKANGYEALHVTVMGHQGEWIEVQIRTNRMHELAEHGLAAHWKYKTGESEESELDKWLREIREALEHPSTDAVEFLGTFKLNLYAHEVFVFTPKGDVKTLPQGATALDFAYHLHSELGEHCIGAKVNHNLVPLSYVLQGGDQVEVLTSTSQRPQENWLELCTTAKAQSCLHAYFRREERQYIRRGEKLFREALELLGIRDQAAETATQRMLNRHGFTQRNELYLHIGQGLIQLDHLQDDVMPKKSIWQRMFSTSSDKETVETTTVATAPIQPQKGKHAITISDENLGRECLLSECCMPIPGDEVLGFLGDDGKMHIHKLTCPEAMMLKSSYGKRIYSVTWNTHRSQSFLETIEIQGIDKFGMFLNVLRTISMDFKINMHAMHVTTQGGIVTAQMELHVYDKEELNRLITALKKLPDVKSVKRTATTL